MKTPALMAVLLVSTSCALADTNSPTAPPVPPPVNYEVWGFHWDGLRYVKQSNYTLTTPDLKKAQDYAAHIQRFGNWTATTNLPLACIPTYSFPQSYISRQQQSAFPTAPTFSVWAFKLTDGAWVRDEKYCWTSPDPMKVVEYAGKVNAVRNWRANHELPRSRSAESAVCHRQYCSGWADDDRLFVADSRRTQRNGSGQRCRKFIEQQLGSELE